mmetsp:Transcript_20171/g.19122  ORF Transcript_20171/g.19122 Transcript_20171/m.19122 type:complete len:110 (-) Transcript_20171:1482-1811(-)
MVNVVEKQLVDGQNTNEVFKYGEELLYQIVNDDYKLASIEILIFLFENVFGPEYITQEKLSPFHIFAKFGQIEALSYCLKLGISPNYRTSFAYNDYPSATALHIGAAYS